MNKQDLIEIYENTKIVSSFIPTPLSEKFSHFFPRKEKIQISVEPIDTISALIKYHSTGKTAILNMASSIRKGGGVAKGAMAQEECLFRASNLYTISDELYPLGITDFIYTEGATFIKNSDHRLMEPIKADVITIAAPNMNKENKHYNPNELEGFDYTSILEIKITQILNAADHYGCKNIILGAWGCGVFKNDPSLMAIRFKDIITENRYNFERIIFAIINDDNSVDNNYEFFRKTFNEI